MRLTTTWKLGVAAVAGVAVLGAGAAVAATKLLSPGERSQAIVNDAAQQLGVSPTKLSDALKKALENQVDAAVTAGTITKEQGDAIKQRIESGDYPIFGGRGAFGVRGHDGFGLGHHDLFGGLDAAATYLGLTEDELRTQLMSGKTLAGVAKDKGKSVSGLVDALVADAKKHLDDAVAAGRLTQAQADQVLSDVKQRVTDRVNGVKGPEGFHGFRRDGGGAFSGPPPIGPPA